MLLPVIIDSVHDDIVAYLTADFWRSTGRLVYIIVEHGDACGLAVEQEGPVVVSIARRGEVRVAVEVRVTDGH